jgi:hypothetical protein
MMQINASLESIRRNIADDGFPMTAKHGHATIDYFSLVRFSSDFHAATEK